MEKFKTYLMEDLIDEIAMGPFGSNIKVDCFVDDGIPVLNGSNLMGYKLNEDSFNYVTIEKANSLNKANAYRGDIIITHRGTLGQIVYIPDNSLYDRYVISQSQFRIKLNKQLALPEYVVYYFHTRIGQYRLLANASQVGVPAIARPTSTFRKVEIELPPIDEQKRIVSVLDSLSNKIELNNRINHNLEQQAQAIFKSWFVDFEPYKDCEFVDSALGLIPKGWKNGALSDISTITMGQSPSGASFNENGDGLLFYQGRTEFGFRYPTIKLFTTEPTRYAEANSILMSVRAPVGDINIATSKCCIGRGLASIKSKDKAFSFLLYTLKNKETELDLYNGEGTVFGSINRKELEQLPIIVPPLDVIDSFNRIVYPLDKEIEKNCREVMILQETRDYLLPSLMTGRIITQHQ